MRKSARSWASRRRPSKTTWAVRWHGSPSCSAASRARKPSNEWRRSCLRLGGCRGQGVQRLMATMYDELETEREAAGIWHARLRSQEAADHGAFADWLA